MNFSHDRDTVILGVSGLLGGEFARYLGARATGTTSQRCDITIASSVSGVLQSVRPTIVINCAAYTDVDRAEKDAETCWKVNADGVRHVAEACNAIGAYLVHVSTDYVFFGDGDRNTPFREDDPCNPKGVYAQSKLAGERLAELCAHHLIVRTCGLYGRSPTQSKTAHFIDKIIMRAERQPVLHVVDDQLCSPSYVSHVVRAVCALVERRVCGTVHVVNRGAATWYQVAREVVRYLQLDARVEPTTSGMFATAAPRPRYSVLDTHRLRAFIGRQLPIWHDAVREYLRRRLDRTENRPSGRPA